MESFQDCDQQTWAAKETSIMSTKHQIAGLERNAQWQERRGLTSQPVSAPPATSAGCGQSASGSGDTWTRSSGGTRRPPPPPTLISCPHAAACYNGEEEEEGEKKEKKSVRNELRKREQLWDICETHASGSTLSIFSSSSAVMAYGMM